MKPFITLDKRTNKLILYVPFKQLWNIEDCALCTAHFADCLVRHNYNVSGYISSSVFAEDYDDTAWEAIYIISNDISASFIENLLYRVKQLTIDHPNHGIGSFKRRNI